MDQTVFKYSDFLPQVWALNSQNNRSTAFQYGMNSFQICRNEFIILQVFSYGFPLTPIQSSNSLSPSKVGLNKTIQIVTPSRIKITACVWDFSNIENVFLPPHQAPRQIQQAIATAHIRSSETAFSLIKLIVKLQVRSKVQVKVLVRVSLKKCHIFLLGLFNLKFLW